MARHGSSASPYRHLWLIAAFIACAGSCVLIYFWREARPLWLDEEMLGLNARDRAFPALIGPLWLGQAAPLGWLALERSLMLAAGLSERGVRALPVLWGLFTLAVVVWVGRRWLGPVGAAVLALLFSFGNHVWFFALELKQYSADTFGGLLLPSLAAWVFDTPADDSSGFARRADKWWIVAGVMQWFSFGALFVTPGCGIVLVAREWRRSGSRAAARAGLFSLFWLLCLGLHYGLSIRYASNSQYLRDYWASAFPPPMAAGAWTTLRWFGGAFDALARIPGGSGHPASFWIVCVAGLIVSLRVRSSLGLPLITVLPSAVLLARLQQVPLAGRVSLWMLPSLYIGIAIAADEATRAALKAVVGKEWLKAVVASACVLVVGRLCLDIYRLGEHDIRIRPRSAHSLDDRAAIRFLLSQRHPGDAMLATHLGLPAVWWYGNVNLSDPGQGASLSDGGPIFEISADPKSACSPDDLRAALAQVNAATMYLGFELENHLEDVALSRLAELGAVTTYRGFAENGHAAVIDLRQPPTGLIQRPGRKGDPLIRPQGCISIQRAHRW